MGNNQQGGSPGVHTPRRGWGGLRRQEENRKRHKGDATLDPPPKASERLNDAANGQQGSQRQIVFVRTNNTRQIVHKEGDMTITALRNKEGETRESVGFGTGKRKRIPPSERIGHEGILGG